MHQKVHGHLPIVDTGAASWIEKAADKHEMIPPEGCIAVAGMERAVVDLQRRMTGETDFAVLRNIVGGMLPHADLVSRIEAAIDRDGTLKDSASPKLKGLRRSIRNSLPALSLSSTRSSCPVRLKLYSMPSPGTSAAGGIIHSARSL